MMKMRLYRRLPAVAVLLMILCGCTEGVPASPSSADSVPPPVAESPSPKAIPSPSPSPSPIPSPSPEPSPSPDPTPKPEPAARLSTEQPVQGQVMGLVLTGMEDAAYELTATHIERSIELFPWNDGLAALIEVPPDAKAGEHTLLVRAVSDTERVIVFELPYTVQKVSFTRQDLTVTEELAEIRTDDNLILDNQKVAKARAETSPEPLWDGVFIQPVEGRISTEFGQVRYTNGQYTSRHSAIDIAAPQGTPILAAAGGRVVFADDLIVSGKTVIIDHGLWLFTTYCHMSDIGVSAGDAVMAGDIIGLVGSTGYSTGPHLHYAASIKSARVNPDILKEHDPLGFLD